MYFIKQKTKYLHKPVLHCAILFTSSPNVMSAEISEHYYLSLTPSTRMVGNSSTTTCYGANPWGYEVGLVEAPPLLDNWPNLRAH